jgi:ankyrin repeat protein
MVDVDAKDDDGRTALHWAAENGHEAEVLLLLEYKTDVDAKNNMQRITMERRHYLVQQRMGTRQWQQQLKHKADVDAKTVSGKTALYLVTENGHEAVVKLLLKHMVDVDVKDNGRTALHWVAENRHETDVRQLLGHKADVDAKDNDGLTAQHQEAKSGHEAVVQLLLKHMADVDAKDNDGWTVLLSRDGDEITRLP